MVGQLPGRRRGVSGGRRRTAGENFVTWEQIEPLLRPGMTGLQIAEAVIASAGLSQERYTILGHQERAGESIHEVLRRGVRIVTHAQSRAEGLKRGAAEDVL